MAVFFHGSFGLNRPRMARLMQMAVQDPELSDADLARAFEYGAPFAATYRSWLHKTGIAKRGRPVRFTEYGKVVLSNDPGLEAPETVWFLHHELTIDPERAEAWHFFMGEFRAKNCSFTLAALQMALMERLRRHSEVHFGPDSRMNPIIVRKLVECYEAADALGSLGLLKRVGSNMFEFCEAAEIGPWNGIEDFKAAYEAR